MANEKAEPLKPQAWIEFARNWLSKTAPDSPRCINCGVPQPQGAMCTAGLWCKGIPYQGCVYEFTLTNDPDAEAKRLAKFAEAVIAAHAPSGSPPTREYLLRELEWRGLTFCEDLREEDSPWEVACEPEPQYFSTLREALDFFVSLKDNPERSPSSGVSQEAAHFVSDQLHPGPSCTLCGGAMRPTGRKCLSCGSTPEPTQEAAMPLEQFIKENADFGPLMPSDIQGIARLIRKYEAGTPAKE